MDTRIDSRQQGGLPSGGIRATAWLLLATIMAAAAALLGATPASAVIKEAEYRVVIDATAHWKLARKIEERTGSNYSRVQIEATAHFDATIENVLFRDGKLITDGHWGKSHFNLTGSGDTNYFRWVTNPQPPHFETQHGFCDAHDDRLGAGTASISRWPEDYDPARGERLRVRIAELAFGGINCTVGPDFGFDLVRSHWAEYTFDTYFDLPQEAIGSGLIIQNVAAMPSQRSPAYCPGKDPAGSAEDNCEFTWSGTVRFEKTGGGEYGELPPLEQQLEELAREEEGDAPPAAPPATVGREPARLGSRTVAFIAHCPTGCRGTAAIVTRGRRPARAAATLARLRFKLPAGAARKVKLRIPARARRALRRARGARLLVTLTPMDGPPVKATVPLRRRS